MTDLAHVRNRARFGVASALVISSLAACATAAPSAAPTGSGTPTTVPTAAPSPTIAGLQHPTGSKDVVLRFEESGGFVPVEFLATAAPSFTLYGDGTVVFRDPTAMPPQSTDNVMRSTPFMTARLDEDAIQALLNDALGPGSLAIAKGPYMGNVADMPTSTFTISIGGQTKQVSAMSLSPDSHEQDKAIIAALAKLADKLNTFGSSIASEQPYIPTAYRGILVPVDQPIGPVLDWPWTDLSPTDFKADANNFLTTHVITPAQVNAINLKETAGGISGVAMRSEGKFFTFSLRPLLPDEAS